MRTNSKENKSSVKKLSTTEFFSISIWVVKQVFKLTPKYATLYAILVVLTRLKDIVNTLIIAKMIDVLVNSISAGTADIDQLYWYLGILLIYNIASAVLNYFSDIAKNGVRFHTPPRISVELYKKLKELGIQALEHPDTNNKIHLAKTYLPDVTRYFFSVFVMISNIVSLITIFVIIFPVYPVYVLIIVAVLLPYFITDRIFRARLYKHIHDHTEDQRKADGAASRLTSSKSLQEITITRSFSFFSKKFIDFKEKYLKKWMEIVITWTFNSNLMWLIADAVVIFAIAKAFTEAINRVISVGDAVFRYRMLFSLENSLISVLSTYNDLGEIALTLRELYEVMELEPSMTDGTISLEKLTKGPEIKLESVSFNYPTTHKLVLNNINLTISSGEKLAIVGANGAGKTTLVKLIARFYQTTSGNIHINGTNINELKSDTLYQNMGVLFQDFNNYPFLTAKENVIVGDTSEKFDKKKLEGAIKKADAAKFISEYKYGLDQILGENFKEGIRPSTGQWQKLAIARFFYRNPALVIFDEPTASIDAVSEYNIFNNIYDYFKNKTVIIISHRFSTVRNADRIIVIDKGKIVEEGTHNKLMKLKGKYAKAFKLQAEGYSIESDGV